MDIKKIDILLKRFAKIRADGVTRRLNNTISPLIRRFVVN